MAGRRRVGIKQRQPGRGKHPLMRWDFTLLTQALSGASGGSDFASTIFDNSALAGNKYVKVGKLTLQQFYLMADQDKLFYLAVYKAKEGAAAESLDDEAAIRDMRSEGRLIRGPWWASTTTPGATSASAMMARKTIVLEDLLLDPNDDIVIGGTVDTSLSGGVNTIRYYVRVFWRVVE